MLSFETLEIVIHVATYKDQNQHTITSVKNSKENLEVIAKASMGLRRLPLIALISHNHRYLHVWLLNSLIRSFVQSRGLTRSTMDVGVNNALDR